MSRRVSGGARTTGLRLAAVAVLLFVALIVAPRIDRYTLEISTTVLIYLAAVQGWNILAGYAGEVSLGTSAFVGAGSYTAAILSTTLGFPPVALVAVSMLVGMILALVLSVPLLRVRGDYFTVATLAAALAVQAIVINVPALGGGSGVNLDIAALPTGATLLYYAAAVAAFAAAASVLVRGSGFGLRLMALRDDADAAQGVGIAVFRHRLGALVLSSALISAGGAVLALQQTSASPQTALAFSWTINVLLMGVVGGLGTLLGPLVGVVVVYYGLTQQLNAFPTAGLVIEGIVLIAVVLLAPRGLWPTLASVSRRAWRRGGGPRLRTANLPAKQGSLADSVHAASPATDGG